MTISFPEAIDTRYLGASHPWGYGSWPLLVVLLPDGQPEELPRLTRRNSSHGGATSAIWWVPKIGGSFFGSLHKKDHRMSRHPGKH